MTIAMAKQLIRVFEHRKLFYGKEYNGVRFKQEHWKALGYFNEQHNNKYFTLINKGIQFSHYVGVIQVGQLTIEVLPKADRGEDDQQKWHKVLLEMLRTCRLLKLESVAEANLRLRSANIFDLYLEVFLKEVESLLHQGLTKKYRQAAGNQLALKGSLQFQQHLTKNAVHKERFFVRYQVYDRVHLIHQLIYKALRVIPSLTNSPDLQDRLGRILLNFPPMPDLFVQDKVFQHIHYDRKTERYRTVLELARMILLNYTPDVRGGDQHVLAILFNMNELFEEYVYRRLKKLRRPDLTVSRQRWKYFWESRVVRPDILLTLENGGTKTTYVLDTKWKVLSKAKPAMEDLRQMYVYNKLFDAPKTALLYPQVYDLSSHWGKFKNEKEDLSCGLIFVRITDESGRLNLRIGEEIVDVLRGESFI
jgi:5-methylcytosine-specific restriction enzyme subunit McrC